MQRRRDRGAPGLFGNENRRFVLTALVDGPRYIRASRAPAASGNRSTWHVVERMVRIGELAKATPGDRTTFAMLDRSFPARKSYANAHRRG